MPSTDGSPAPFLMKSGPGLAPGLWQVAQYVV